MLRSWLTVLSAWLGALRTILYAELRDVSLGLPMHPRWFLMRMLGRFERGKSLVMYLRRRRTRRHVHGNGYQRQDTIFPDVDIEHAIDCLKKDGVYLGLHLPEEVVRQIVKFAAETYCYGNHKPHWGFYYSRKDIASRKLNINFLTGDYYNTFTCKAIQSVVEDPNLLKISQNYLTGFPVHQGTNLRWSFATTSSAFDRYRANQTFHYDLDDYCSLKFFFYLTDVGTDDGPHVCILGSHVSKKFAWKVFRGTYDDDQVMNYYTAGRMKFIYGNSGYGFVEDSSIIHKGATPLKNDRLILIIEYALRDYAMQHDHIAESELQPIDFSG
jgi:hypothetical protein